MIVPLNDLSYESSNCNILFWQFLSICSFLLVSCSIKDNPWPEVLLQSVEWPEIWLTGVSWTPSELNRFWSQSADFPCFGAILTWWNRANLGFTGIFFLTQGNNGLKFDPDQLQNWLDCGHGVLIFFIFVMSDLWFHANLTGIWLQRGVAATWSSLSCHIQKKEKGKF